MLYYARSESSPVCAERGDSRCRVRVGICESRCMLYSSTLYVHCTGFRCIASTNSSNGVTSHQQFTLALMVSPAFRRVNVSIFCVICLIILKVYINCPFQLHIACKLKP